MDAVVVEPEADQQRVHAEHVLEVADDRDRAAGADRDRLAAPFRRQCRLSLPERRAVIRQLQRRVLRVIDEFRRAIPRQALADERAKRLADLPRVLLADQAERDLGGSRARDDGLRSFPGIAADDAVDVAGRPGRHLLDQDAVLFAGRNFQTDLAEEILGPEVELLPLLQHLGRRVGDALVELGLASRTRNQPLGPDQHREHDDRPVDSELV